MNAVSSTIDAPLEWVETVGNLRLPPKANQRLQELMDRNNEGLLTEAERRIWNHLLNSVSGFRWYVLRRFTCWGVNPNELVE